ncbi:hypothetical protein AUC60_17730 [Pseudomonas caspiana]|uniref:Uncharacterized protein n=1 Tax=Pseudomonas caspiana TaxID=1451454 RepID=A0A1Y3NXW1_9PSED|nr:hypothetical protein AUC60_17730 [Pseudomonas caspiana]
MFILHPVAAFGKKQLQSDLPDLPMEASPEFPLGQMMEAAAAQLSETARRESIHQEFGMSALETSSDAESQRESVSNLSIPLADKNLSLGRHSVSVSTQDTRFRLGGGISGGEAATKIELGKLFSDRFAVGGMGQFGKHQSEWVGRGVYLTPDKKYEFDNALSFMRGTPLFNFDSGETRTPVTQVSGVSSVRHLFHPESGIGFHSIGGSVWAAQAQSKSNLAAKLVIKETPTYYSFLYDPREIATGKLKGTSVDAQYAPTQSLVFNGSIGMEEVSYAMGDSSKEIQRRPYFSGGVKAELFNNSLVSLGVSNGVARNLSLGMSYGISRLTVGVSSGRDGALSNKSLMFDIDLGALLSKKSAGSNEFSSSLARRESMQVYSSQALLEKAVTRPMKLPSSFLAKVDRTGVKRVTVDKSKLPPGTKVSANSNEVVIPIGIAGLRLVSAKRNGSDIGLPDAFVLGSGEVSLRTNNLPVPGGIDTYTLRVVDSVGATYDLKVSVGSANS